MSSTVDLYLYASNAGLIHAFTQVPFSSGSFTYQLLPKWWNSTTTADLQLAIINSGNAAWMTSSRPARSSRSRIPLRLCTTTSMSGGSVVTATNAAAATNSADAVFQDVSSTKSGGLSKGAIAAAVIVPLIVLAIAIAVFVRFWRAREAEKRKRWSQALSRHSTLEWRRVLSRATGQSVARPSLCRSSAAPTPREARSPCRNTPFLDTRSPRLPSTPSRTTWPVPVPADRLSPTLARTRLTTSPPVHSFRADGPGARQSRISFAETVRPERPGRSSFAGDLRPNLTASGVFKMPGASKSATDFHSPSGKRSALNNGSAIADDDEEYSQAFADAEARRIAGIKPRNGRKSILSLGGSRRDSVSSQTEPEDFKSAASARGQWTNSGIWRRPCVSEMAAHRFPPLLTSSGSTIRHVFILWPAITQSQ